MCNSTAETAPNTERKRKRKKQAYLTPGVSWFDGDGWVGGLQLAGASVRYINGTLSVMWRRVSLAVGQARWGRFVREV